MIAALEQINKTYFNTESRLSREVLKGVSLKLNTGDVLSIVGPSGSGKSTLLNILGTLDLPTSGSVQFNGKEINNYNPDQLAAIRNNEIGFVFQSHHLLPQLNLIENVLLPTLALKQKSDRNAAFDRAIQLLEKVGLADKSQQFPGQLSGGECQRTAVIRALINEPQLILADEPTGSLDDESAGKIGDLLVNINKEQNVGLVVVTHSVQLAKKIGNVHQLIKGKLMKYKEV